MGGGVGRHGLPTIGKDKPGPHGFRRRSPARRSAVGSLGISPPMGRCHDYGSSVPDRRHAHENSDSDAYNGSSAISPALEFLDAVLAVVERIPSGRATTYGVIAEEVRAQLGRGGPRQVGTVMARAGGGVAWWRVVNAAGRPPQHLADAAAQHWRDESMTVSSDGTRVVLAACGWEPAEDDTQHARSSSATTIALTGE